MKSLLNSQKAGDSLEYKKIEDNDLLGVGVIGLDDSPGFSTEEMQRKFEQTVREVVIPAFNALVDALIERDNSTFTREEVYEELRKAVFSTGAADMQKYVYDKNDDGVVDKAESLKNYVKIGDASFNGSKDITLAQMGAATKSQGDAIDKITTDIKAIKYVTSLPANPDANTLYLVKK